MKLILLLLIVPLIHANASGYAQGITISKQNATLPEIFKEVGKQTDFTFIYSNTQISKAKKVSITVKNAEITAVLNQCFKNQDLSYTINNKVITIKEKPQASLGTSLNNLSATTVSGTVSDEQGKPLPGATVKLQGSQNATRTNDQGFFSIISEKNNGTLTIAYLGYQSEQVNFNADNSGPFKVVLKEVQSGLKEVEINAGYYTVKEKERTGSISRVSEETIRKQPVSNVLGALIGRMAGVNIEQQSGRNGGGLKVEIRGVNSLRPEGRQPLYLIDGIQFPANPITNSTSLSISGISQYASPLNNLNPSDIESIEVLKDADATAIYGSRGANGVILITTKKAKTGTTSLDVKVYSGISKVKQKLKLLNTSQYLEMRNEAFKNDGVTPVTTDYDVNGTWDQNRYTDWQKTLIGETASNTNVNTTISGGNEMTQFSLRGNFSRQTTVSPGDFSEKKGSGTLTVNHTALNRKIKIGFATTYAHNNNDLPQSDLMQFINLPPNAPTIYKEDGSLNWELNSAGVATWENPLATTLNKYNGKINTLLSSGFLNYQILHDLNIAISTGYTNIEARENLLAPIKAQAPTSSAIGVNTLAFNNIETWTIEPKLNYTKAIGNSKLKVLLGSTFQLDNQNSETILGIGSTNDLLLENINAAPIKSASATSSAYRYTSLYTRLNYDYKEKYILNVTGRRDGSSRFGPNRQFANFAAIGAAWIFTEENLIKNKLQFISYGKLRGSYGITGSDQIPNYGYLETYSATEAYAEGSGLFPTRIANPDYSWENNKKLEIALDLGFLQDRFSISSSWYRNRSSNQLVGYTLPDIAGFPSIQYNLPANVQNTGWEFEITTSNINNKIFSWKTGLNITIPNNKLLSYPNILGSTYANTYMVGESLFTPKAYHYLGVNADNGLFRYEDLNSSGTIDVADRKAANKALTTHAFGGIFNTLTYKNFSLDIFVQMVSKTSRTPFAQFSSPGTIGNQPLDVLERWQYPGDDKNVQKFSQTFGSGSAASIFNFILNSDQFMDASFMRLKNVSLSWNAPNSLAKKLKLRNFRFYLQGQNLFTLTSYPGDPEIISIKALPTLTTVTAGIQVTL